MKFCKLEVSNQILTVTIDRPEVLNALYADAHRELAGVWSSFESDRNLRVAILTGSGTRSFCSGNDLKIMASGLPRSYVPEGFGGLIGRSDITKPIIAAVNGVAMGGGFELALACDLIVATDTAIFSLPEPTRGLVALGGGIHRLPRQIPLKAAMGILLTGRKVTAAEGRELGFINEVTTSCELMECAKRWANLIISGSPNAISITKSEVLNGLSIPSLESALRTQEDARQRVYQHSDSKEGPKAFFEKRRPVWNSK